MSQVFPSNLLGESMFKQIIVGVMSAGLLLSSVPSEAAFGRSSTASSSNSYRSSSSSSSARSSSAAAPSASARSGGISQGSSIGMTRSNVTNSVRDGSYKQNLPANNSTVAGSGVSRNSGNTYYSNGGGGTYYSNEGRSYYNQPYQGHSTGALVAAAGAGALAGYLLHRDSYGNAYYTNPNNPGVYYNPNGQVMSSVPAGVGGGTNVVYEQPSSGHGFIFFLLGVLLILLIIGVAVALFSKKKTDGEPAMSLFGKNPEEQLRDDADNFFRSFQKNNRPSQLEWVRQNSDEGFFEAVKDMVVQSPENKDVTVLQLEHELVDLTQEGTKYIGSIRYQARVRETVNGEVTETPIDEVWHFIYQGKWRLAGIEQVNG
jgi:hypothetical protein